MSKQAGAVTPGPWEQRSYHTPDGELSEILGVEGRVIAADIPYEDAKLIVTTVNALFSISSNPLAAAKEIVAYDRAMERVNRHQIANEQFNASGDVEKLIEFLHNVIKADEEYQALAAEKAAYVQLRKHDASTIASLRAKLERARDVFGNLFAIRYPKQRHARSCECEICVARATLEEIKEPKP